MKRNSARRAGALWLTAGLALGVTGCSNDGPGTAAPRSASAASEAAAPGAGVPTPSTPAPATSPGTVAISYADGKVSGVGERTRLPLGAAVTLTVSSDVADEVHVHGYDKSAEVAAGGTVTLSFTANIPGVFEVELEDAGTPLTRLQVQ